MKTRLPILVAIFISTFPAASAAEILLHDGPDVSIALQSPSKAANVEDGLAFKKQFYVDPETLRKQPPTIDTLSNPATNASTAINAAKATVDLGQKETFRVVRLELLRSTTEKPVDFYLIEMLVNGSTEHRIVLMNGTVIKPRL